VDLGFVSAYILVRGTEAAIVDTGGSGSEGAIEASLSAVGLAWANVGHVVLTHLHGDHIGSVGPVMTAAAQADGYAGAADIPRIDAPRTLIPVGTGDAVFGLDIISTPGHTPGHISVFDPESRSLITGDAVNGAGSGMQVQDGIAGPNPQFTPDMDAAAASVVELAALAPRAVFFGHGEPLLQDAAAALDSLTRS
jgi:glyoxylase-like metal-dependent hydrolase (beta-lactamase superfamily II)